MPGMGLTAHRHQVTQPSPRCRRQPGVTDEGKRAAEGRTLFQVSSRQWPRWDLGSESVSGAPAVNRWAEDRAAPRGVDAASDQTGHRGRAEGEVAAGFLIPGSCVGHAATCQDQKQ